VVLLLRASETQLDRRTLGTVVGLALLVRLITLAAAWDDPVVGDALFYSEAGNLLAEGNGFVNPFAGASGLVPSAAHPPLFTTYLSAWSFVGADTTNWHRIASILLGTATVGLVAASAAHVGGRRAALVAGGLAAAWPNLWYWEVGIQAEALASTFVAAFTLASLRFFASPSRGRLLIVAVTVALAALTRAELVLLAVALIPMVAVVAGISRAIKAGWLGAAALTIAVTIAPWAAYNSTRFDRPVPLSNGLGLVLIGSNCDAAYYGSNIGYWWYGCSSAGSASAGVLPTDDPSEQDALKRRVAVAYALDHPTRLPAVAGARAARYFGLWSPWQAARLADTQEGMERDVNYAAQLAWLVGIGMAVVGGRKLHRDGTRLLPLLAAPTVGVVTAVLIYAVIRFRAPTEPPVIILAAVGVLHLLDWRAPTRGAAQRDPTPTPRRVIVKRAELGDQRPPVPRPVIISKRSDAAGQGPNHA